MGGAEGGSELGRRDGICPTWVVGWWVIKSTLGKAVRYLLNEYMALVGYLRDG
jgi:hypothetical protein